MLDPFFASADITISETALPIDHLVVLDSEQAVRAGVFRVTGCGPLSCLRDHNPPFGKLSFDPVANTPFTVTLTFDDPDGDIVQAEIAIEELSSEQILAESPFRTYRTDLSDPGPETIELVSPALPPGDYIAIGILGDGLENYVVLEVPFTLGPPPPDVPTTSAWGMVAMALMLPVVMMLIVQVRRRNSVPGG